jgi:hypothetical protein
MFRILYNGWPLLAGCLLACIFLSTSIATAADFPAAPADDTIPSMGVFIIWVHEDYRSLVNTQPGWDQPEPDHWTSFLLMDRDTVIGHSGEHQDGDAADTGGTAVGTAATMVKDSDFAAVPTLGFTEGHPGTAEVHTEIVSLRLEDPTCSYVLRAGTAEGLTKPSLGEVEALGAADFPAESFFAVFFEVDTPFGTLYATEPVLLVGNNLNDLPPRTIYIHEESDAVPVYFKGGADADKLFGYLRLAGHGASLDCFRTDVSYSCPDNPATLAELALYDKCPDKVALFNEVARKRLMKCDNCVTTQEPPVTPAGLPWWFWLLIIIILILVVIIIILIRK